MEAAPITRMRWRLSGAWLWPTFVVLTVADAGVIHTLPLSGTTASWISGWLLGAVLSLIAIIVLAGPLGAAVRWLHPDMPRVVARNYAGALVTLAVTLALLAGGIVHQHVITSDNFAFQDATARAQAYIGDHAPQAFQTGLRRLDTVEVQAPDIYRTCASDVTQRYYYCVVVNRSQPYTRSVHYSGAESNELLAQATG